MCRKFQFLLFVCVCLIERLSVSIDVFFFEVVILIITLRQITFMLVKSLLFKHEEELSFYGS